MWESHWRRLTENAVKVGIDLSEHSEEGTKQNLDAAIKQAGIVHGRARITFYDERPTEIWPAEIEPGPITSLHIVVDERRPVPKDFTLTVSPYPVNSFSPLAGVKSCNYLEQILSLDEAKSRGFDEAVRINQSGFITSGCMANIFSLTGGQLYTPALSTGCLAGTTREFVLENLECREAEFAIDCLDTADAIFLTSAGLGVTQIAAFGSKRFEMIDHPILNLLPNDS